MTYGRDANGMLSSLLEEDEVVAAAETEISERRFEPLYVA